MATENEELPITLNYNGVTLKNVEGTIVFDKDAVDDSSSVMVYDREESMVKFRGTGEVECTNSNEAMTPFWYTKKRLRITVGSSLPLADCEALFIHTKLVSHENGLAKISFAFWAWTMNPRYRKSA